MSIAISHGGTASSPDEHSVEVTLTAIKAKWFLGGRKVISTFTCLHDPATHKAQFRESAVEHSFGGPPPTFSAQTSSQYGTRVKETRVDRCVGRRGRLEFGKLRESVEQAVKDPGWEFVCEVV